MDERIVKGKKWKVVFSGDRAKIYQKMKGIIFCKWVHVSSVSRDGGEILAKKIRQGEEGVLSHRIG